MPPCANYRGLNREGVTFEGTTLMQIIGNESLDLAANGRLTWDNGDVYTGEFKDGKRGGRGVMTWKDGDVNVAKEYDGEWMNDMMHGHGKLTFPDGRYADAVMFEGNMHGPADWYDAAGTFVRKATYENDTECTAARKQPARKQAVKRKKEVFHQLDFSHGEFKSWPVAENVTLREVAHAIGTTVELLVEINQIHLGSAGSTVKASSKLKDGTQVILPRYAAEDYKERADRAAAEDEAAAATAESGPKHQRRRPEGADEADDIEGAEQQAAELEKKITGLDEALRTERENKRAASEALAKFRDASMVLAIPGLESQVAACDKTIGELDAERLKYQAAAGQLRGALTERQRLGQQLAATKAAIETNTASLATALDAARATLAA